MVTVRWEMRRWQIAFERRRFNEISFCTFWTFVPNLDMSQISHVWFTSSLHKKYDSTKWLHNLIVSLTTREHCLWFLILSTFCMVNWQSLDDCWRELYNVKTFSYSSSFISWGRPLLIDVIHRSVDRVIIKSWSPIMSSSPLKPIVSRITWATSVQQTDPNDWFISKKWLMSNLASSD